MKKLITITLCAAILGTTQLCTANELDANAFTAANISRQQALLPDNESVSYGLIPSPFKIITKTATAPIRAARSKIKAAQKAAKLAKRGVDTVKGIDGDGKGKGPTPDYEKTPYTKDKYYITLEKEKASKKAAKKSSKDRYKDYEFNTDVVDTYDTPYAKRHSSGTITTAPNKNLVNANTSTVARPNSAPKSEPTTTNEEVKIASSSSPDTSINKPNLPSQDTSINKPNLPSQDTNINKTDASAPKNDNNKTDSTIQVSKSSTTNQSITIYPKAK